ncbi:FAD:protein FMN transferase [Lentiprolixibacter aurantiacus]|uniref:FAD:protein FMN transferase n=1 Tax=Lentiprolixibacter aurantiacus TaxID=2993939 RepID=A0AAE3MKU5_9FLAO|nr:FAD:protein FMN transferase [Lentiprolixibacter aurantiacus]
MISMGACADEKGPWERNFNYGGALGTSYSITYLSSESLNFQEEIDSVFQVVNQSMSTYWPESDISRINRGDSTIVVDDMFREVFELSKEVHEKTQGYFDPTVGVLVNAWGFGPGRGMELDSAKVDSLLQYVGFDKVSLTQEGRVRKEDPAIRFDFNAIAKGYAIDRLALMLDNNGIENYLVEVGGEIVARGENKIKDKPWVLGIDDPQVEEGRRLKVALELTDAALASSGNYRKFRIDSITGEKYVHTIDPKTGFTRNSKVLSASVIAPACAEADAFATAFMAMDLEDSRAILEREKQLEAYLIYLDEAQEVQEFVTEGFKKRIVRN